MLEFAIVFMLYFPIVLLFLAVAAFVFGTIAVTHLLGPKRKTLHKQEAFECGVPSEGDARSPFSVKYCLIAVLFVLFDVEVIFFYPWAVNFKALGWSGFLEVMCFMGTVFVGFFFLVKHRIFDFEKN